MVELLLHMRVRLRKLWRRMLRYFVEVALVNDVEVENYNSKVGDDAVAKDVWWRTCGEGHVVVYVIEGCCDRYCCGEGSCS